MDPETDSVDTTEPSTSGTSPQSTAAKSKGGKRKATPPSQPNTKKQRATASREWRRADLSNRQKARFGWKAKPSETTRLPTDPVRLFGVFFDDDVISMIVENSILYARSKGNNTFTTTPDELRAFLGILIVSGYNPAPRRHLYWARDADVHNEAISSAMTRNRFTEMMRYLHCCDNARLDADDKLSKVRPLVSMVNERFLTYFTFFKTQNLSIDESMVPYFGKHGAKQFIRGKPIRFGYKMWVLTTPLGYVLQFEPYQGARGRQTEYPGLGMGGSVVVDLIAELQADTGDSFHLTFDNLFTSLALVDCLTEKNIACTGTIRANRIGDCPLKSAKEIEKSPRGTFDYACDTQNGMVIVRWNDNSVVNAVSNKVGVYPVQTAKRWSRSDGKRVDIGQPFLIKHYNKTMGGVDRMDQNVDKYRTAIRSKKWWWPIFAFCLDLCIQQTWHLHRLTQESLNKTNDLLAIRRTIARALLARGPRPLTLGRPIGFPSSEHRVPAQIRFDRLDHLVEPWPTQLKCACCGMKTKHRCSKCKVGVHDRCFIKFHSK